MATESFIDFLVFGFECEAVTDHEVGHELEDATGHRILEP